MCMKPAKSDSDRQVQGEQDERHQADPVRTWQNTRPRGNPQRDDHDVERGIERLATLVGR